MKRELGFENWLLELGNNGGLVEFMLEYDDLEDLTWALINGRNDSINQERKRLLRALRDRYQQLADDEHISVVWWE